MFSSVVAAILLMTGIVLVSTLISTEEKTSGQIYYMINSFRLNDAATLARADAIQNFNYYFREELERYLTFDESEIITDPGYPLINMENYNDWELIKDNFEKVILLTDNATGQRFDSAIDYVARKTIEQFQDGSYGRYHIALNDRSSEAKASVKRAITTALSDTDEFLDVVNCEEDNCEVGTFYFIIPLNKIPEDEYEKLPRIIVRDIITNEEIRIAVLPKTELRVYVPLRFFKALHEARKQATAIANIEDDLEEARIGFCGDGCVPNKDPLNVDDTDNWNQKCPGATSEGIYQELDTSINTGITQYNTAGENLGPIPLTAFTRSIICEATQGLGEIDSGPWGFKNKNYGTNTGLEPEGVFTNRVNDCAFAKIGATTYTYPTKLIETTATPLNCAQLTSTNAHIVYEETNPAYIVTGEKLYYKIQITTGPYTHNASSNGVCAKTETGDTGTCVKK